MAHAGNRQHGHARFPVYPCLECPENQKEDRAETELYRYGLAVA
nr:MAG TPA: hypothetical protein [Caudoviricetes sp.]